MKFLRYALYAGGGLVVLLVVALVAAVDHAPGQSRAGDHPDDGLRMGTGYFGKDGSPGLVTMLNRHFSASASAVWPVCGA